jgi:hypothetical protein
MIKHMQNFQAAASTNEKNNFFLIKMFHLEKGETSIREILLCLQQKGIYD